MTPQQKQQYLQAILNSANVNIAGDLVMEKHVQYEIENVEQGAVGIQIINNNNNNNNTTPPETQQEQATPSTTPSPAIHIPQTLLPLLQKLQEEHILDQNLQPSAKLTWAQKAILAGQLALKAQINNKWTLFAKLWHTKSETLRSAYNRAMEQKNTQDFLGQINPLLK